MAATFLDDYQQAALKNLQCIQLRDSARGQWTQAQYRNTPIHLPYAAVNPPDVTLGDTLLKFGFRDIIVVGILPFGTKRWAEVAFLLSGTIPPSGRHLYWITPATLTQLGATGLVDNAVNTEYPAAFLTTCGIMVAFPQHYETPSQVSFARYFHERRALKVHWPFLPSELSAHPMLASLIPGKKEDIMRILEFAAVDLLDYIESNGTTFTDRQVLMGDIGFYPVLAKASLLYAGLWQGLRGMQWMPGFNAFAEQCITDDRKQPRSQHIIPDGAASNFFALYKKGQGELDACKTYGQTGTIDAAAPVKPTFIGDELFYLARWAQERVAAGANG